MGTTEDPWVVPIDATGASTSTTADTKTPSSLKAHIRATFHESPFTADVLSNRSDALNPDPLIQLFANEADESPARLYIRHLFSVFEDTVAQQYEAEANLEAEQTNIQNECVARVAVEENLATTQAQLVRVQTQLREQNNTPAAAAQNPNNRIPQARQTTHNPEPFKGEKTNALIRQEEYISWKIGLQLCWGQDTAYFDTERKKLFHLATLLEGSVRQERQKDIQAILNNTSPFVTADAFLGKLDGLYIYVDMERDASIKFDKLKMTEKQSFASFYSSLEKLGDMAEKSDREMVLALKQKVTTGLKHMVIMDHLPCAANDIQGWKNRFQVWDQNMRENACYLGSNSIAPASLCVTEKSATPAVNRNPNSRGGSFSHNYNSRGGAQTPVRGNYNGWGQGNTGDRGHFSPYQQHRLYATQGYVEEGAVAPSESASNISTSLIACQTWATTLH
ncbi:hypothetical protein SBOR_9729 [Sclerotinia borealis F-4128]|uniref:Retrotransposon gag domain-containing protein n=1 Tax=Sclerotinia borealis (strain F-4128) TaxID=1432307 RepID=W9C5Q8_SCLBF|nr:hypothetical protein SBOR_9729 [Sclerotinia borealis F-4128]